MENQQNGFEQQATVHNGRGKKRKPKKTEYSARKKTTRINTDTLEHEGNFTIKRHGECVYFYRSKAKDWH